MKIKISFDPLEEAEVYAVINAIKKVNPSLKIKTSDKHPPYKQIYITIGDNTNKLR